MEGVGLLAFLIVIGLISAGLAARHKRRTETQLLSDGWGKGGHAQAMDADAMDALRKCYREMPKPETAYHWVDEITWNDLDMDAVFQHLNRTQSGAGEEALYSMLHGIDASGDDLVRRDRWMNAFAGDDDSRIKVQRRLRKLGRDHDHGAFAFIEDPQASKPQRAWVYYALALTPFVFIALGFVNPYWLLGLLASFLVNAAMYYATKKTWMRELAAVRHLAAVLRIGRRMRHVTVRGAEDGFTELNTLSAKLRAVGRWNGLFNMQRVADFDFITDYLRIAFQLDMIALCRLTDFIKGHSAAILRVYQLVGEMDACIAVASARLTVRQYAVPEFWAEKRVDIADVAHPLLKKPILNDMDWAQNVLVTGSNASGKSTFVKAVAVNCVLAQSVCTCFAGRVRMPRAQVYTSMALRDNVQGGESYYIVEIKSLKRILTALREDALTLCFIDEILRGTNTVERIAASKSLLSYISGQNALCIAATHDIELTRLLPDYRQVHFREQITKKGMLFPYRLMEGVSDTRNAIRLLEQMGFPQEVIHAADEMAGEPK